MKFTFKTEKPTGKYKSFLSEVHYIKLNGNIVGSIDDNYPHKIRLMVVKDDINEDGNQNCSWKWITLKGHYSSVDEAKDFVRRKNDAIIERFNIYYK